MAESTPSVFSRIAIAFATFWRALVDPPFAAAVDALRSTAVSAPGPERPALLEAEPNAALQLLGLLQQEGRFIDFIEEDVAVYTDEEVGAAARIVHEGCRRTLRQHFDIEVVRAEEEGVRVTLADGFDSSAIRLTGNVVGQAPFTGSLTHRGWRVTQVKLPQVASGHDLTVLAPAEVEL